MPEFTKQEMISHEKLKLAKMFGVTKEFYKNELNKVTLKNKKVIKGKESLKNTSIDLSVIAITPFILY
jgi:plasmid maintenance system antidote protein VapI